MNRLALAVTSLSLAFSLGLAFAGVASAQSEPPPIAKPNPAAFDPVQAARPAGMPAPAVAAAPMAPAPAPVKKAAAPAPVRKVAAPARKAPMHPPQHVAARASAGSSGRSSDHQIPAEQRATEAMNVMQSQGFGDFKNFRPDGRNFTATVMKNGQPVTIVIDPDSGQVTTGS